LNSGLKPAKLKPNPLAADSRYFAHNGKYCHYHTKDFFFVNSGITLTLTVFIATLCGVKYLLNLGEPCHQLET
jgi:hypothetical protein